jgi:hypothetical protein
LIASAVGVQPAFAVTGFIILVGGVGTLIALKKRIQTISRVDTNLT